MNVQLGKDSCLRKKALTPLENQRARLFMDRNCTFAKNGFDLPLQQRTPPRGQRTRRRIAAAS
jgi:hypothetical protein